MRLKSISIKIKKLRQSFQSQSKIFVSLFSFILIFNSLALPALAADSSAAGSPELIDYSELTEDELLSISTDEGYLPSGSVTPKADVIPARSYDGTSLFDDLDDSESDIYYVDPSEYPSDEWRPWAFRGEVAVRYFYLDYSSSSVQVEVFYDYLTVDLDSPLSISLRKNTGNGVLMHSIRYTQNSSIGNLDQVMFFPEFSLDDYQGFYCSVTDSSNNLETSILNGSYCEPTWNVTYQKNSVIYPGYYAEFPQVYANIVIPSELLEQAALGSGYINVYAIPTNAGQYTIREFQTNNIIVSQNRYGKILIQGDLQVSALPGDDIVRIYYQFYAPDGFSSSYNNLIPNPQRYAVSPYLDRGPLTVFDLSFFYSEDNELYKRVSFPKYYDPLVSDLSFYIASEAQYNDYLSSDQKVEDDYQQQKANYEEKSEEFKEAIKAFEQLPKPDITSNTVILPSGSVESIDELSGILSIIWEDKMVKEMLIISLTFVFVGYILFGKRG